MSNLFKKKWFQNMTRKKEKKCICWKTMILGKKNWCTLKNHIHALMIDEIGDIQYPEKKIHPILK